MLISSDKFLKGKRNEGNICQPFDSLCKHIRLSAKSEERRAAIDQEEIGPFLRLAAAGVLRQSRRRSREVNVFMEEQPDKSRPYFYWNTETRLY